MCVKIRLVALQFSQPQPSEIENRGWERTFATPGIYLHLSYSTTSVVIHDLLLVQPEGLAGVDDGGGLEVLPDFVHGKFRA